jgi:hypothetical protein
MRVMQRVAKRVIAALDDESKFDCGVPSMWASLRNLSRSFKPGGIIDVGANVGNGWKLTLGFSRINPMEQEARRAEWWDRRDRWPPLRLDKPSRKRTSVRRRRYRRRFGHQTGAVYNRCRAARRNCD